MTEEKLVNQPSAEAPPLKGSRRYCELITKKKGGESFIRRIMAKGRPYYQLVRWVYRDDKRKLEVLKHLGTRKPRGYDPK